MIKKSGGCFQCRYSMHSRRRNVAKVSRVPARGLSATAGVVEVEMLLRVEHGSDGGSRSDCNKLDGSNKGSSVATVSAA